jgi:hypothetical protein
VAYYFCKHGYSTFEEFINSGMTIDHDDDNKLNNYYKNLKFLTRIENLKKAWKNGLCANSVRKGVNNSLAKHTEEEIIEVCKYLAEGKMPTEISRLTNVKSQLISKIKLKQRWKEVSDKYF